MKTRIPKVRIPPQDIERLQEEANTILERDETFITNVRQLRCNRTSGVVPPATFAQVFAWQARAALRRAGVSLRKSQAYLRVVTF